jgi:hypothetical protein
MLKAGLLTYSRFSVFPYHINGTVTYRLKNVIELTAAGQLQIYTVFPFNSGCKAGNQKRCKSNKIKQHVKWMMENGGFNRKR